jgi:hypothetical protein
VTEYKTIEWVLHRLKTELLTEAQIEECADTVEMIADTLRSWLDGPDRFDASSQQMLPWIEDMVKQCREILDSAPPPPGISGRN